MREQLEDTVATAYYKHEITGEYYIEIAEPKAQMRMKRNPLGFFKVSFDGMKVETRASIFSGADPMMRAMKRDWMYPEVYDFEHAPTLVGAVPDIISNFSDSGTIHKQYSFHVHVSHRTPGMAPDGVHQRKQYAKSPVKQYRRIIAMTAGSKPWLDEPTY